MDSTVVKLGNIVTLGELNNEAQFLEMEKDMRDEGARYGSVVSVICPRPNFLKEKSNQELTYSEITGAYNLNLRSGFAYVQFSTAAEAAVCLAQVQNRTYRGRIVQGCLFPEAKFEQDQLD